MTEVAAAPHEAEPQLERQLEQHRRELTGYCYRMLGSAFEAEDAVQETMVRAWRGLRPVRGPLVAAVVALPDRHQRVPRHAGRPQAPGAADGPRRRRHRRGRPLGDALPESRLAAADAGRPRAARRRRSGRAGRAARESIRLAFVAALQHLPPRQRAVLILREVLRWKADGGRRAARHDRRLGEQRAAAGPGHAGDASGAADEPTSSSRRRGASASCWRRYVDAFERYDIDALVALLHEDATLSMPPYALWLRGSDDIAAVAARAAALGCRGSRLRADGRQRLARRSGSTARAPAAGTRRGRCRCSRSPTAGSSGSTRSSTPRRCSRCSGCRSRSSRARPRIAATALRSRPRGPAAVPAEAGTAAAHAARSSQRHSSCSGPEQSGQVRQEPCDVGCRQLDVDGAAGAAPPHGGVGYQIGDVHGTQGKSQHCHSCVGASRARR